MVKFEDIWTSDHDPSDRDAHGDKRVAEEQRERFKLTDELGFKRNRTYVSLFFLKKIIFFYFQKWLFVSFGGRVPSPSEHPFKAIGVEITNPLAISWPHQFPPAPITQGMEFGTPDSFYDVFHQETHHSERASPREW